MTELVRYDEETGTPIYSHSLDYTIEDVYKLVAPVLEEAGYKPTLAPYINGHKIIRWPGRAPHSDYEIYLRETSKDYPLSFTYGSMRDGWGRPCRDIKDLIYHLEKNLHIFFNCNVDAKPTEEAEKSPVVPQTREALAITPPKVKTRQKALKSVMSVDTTDGKAEILALF